MDLEQNDFYLSSLWYGGSGSYVWAEGR